MRSGSNTITAYEYDTLRSELTAAQLAALQRYHGVGECPYYALVHKGIKLRGFVGVLRVGELTLEVLPKADRNSEATEWRRRLLDMLRVVHRLKPTAPSTAALHLRPDAILHLYFELFVNEVEQLLRQGLFRSYQCERTNATALSGRLLFAEHLRHNLVHRERFFVERDRYDFANTLNRVLLTALQLVRRLNRQPELAGRIRTLEEAFPPIREIRVSQGLFDRLKLTRQTKTYGPALQIARLLLLRYHPGLRGGKEEVLALLFRMDQLWEEFLLISLRRYLPEEYTVAKERGRQYWETRGFASTIEPDIMIRRAGEVVAILDAKWKTPELRPSPGDLQQLYTYAHFHGAEWVALVYPRVDGRGDIVGSFRKSGVRGDMVFVPVPRVAGHSVQFWMQSISDSIRDWLGECSGTSRD